MGDVSTASRLRSGPSRPAGCLAALVLAGAAVALGEPMAPRHIHGAVPEPRVRVSLVSKVHTDSAGAVLLARARRTVPVPISWPVQYP
jgi:hypothetical protein